VPVEFIGIARTADRSETIAETGPAVQPEYLYHLAVSTSSRASTGCSWRTVPPRPTGSPWQTRC